ncbi:FRG domain-containing protein [Dyadobacter sp. OTU695]|uniref:FRG domain-containing protein n=1 Tax=Dyadobacter sp. OTU695 TaxID=3043860 RepID=UPI00313C32C5
MSHLNEIVVEKKFNSAIDFLDFLSPTRDSFGKGSWVYRGHGNANWDLLPSLFRTPRDITVNNFFNSCLKFYRSKGFEDSWETYPFPDRHVVTQITHQVETRFLRSFANRANKIGLPVPDIEKILNKPKDQLPNFPEYATMEPPLFKLNAKYYCEFLMDENRRPGLYAGLAQHHGIPTRLLDFTFNSMKAIHFAVKSETPNDICVWAVNSDYFERDMFTPWEELLFQSQGHNMISQHSVLRMPTSTNLFLHHQEGLFIYPDLPYDFYFGNNRYPTIIDHLSFLANNPFDGSPKRFGDYAYKLVLASEHYKDLKSLIRKLGLTLSSVMPTYDNVAEEIRQEETDFW